VKCKICGHENDSDASFCEECGNEIGKDTLSRPKSSKKETEGLTQMNKILIVSIIALVAVLGIMAGVLLKAPNNSNTTIPNSTVNNEPISMSTGFPVSQVPNLAQEISKIGVGFDTITFKGVTLDKNQCLYILSKGIVMIDSGQTGNIPIGNYGNPDSPFGTITAATITKSQYVDMAQRTHSWMDNNGLSPNYIGISVAGQPDLSPESLLNLYVNVLTQYKSTNQLPPSVIIP
jgi:hypothetical protein